MMDVISRIKKDPFRRTFEVRSVNVEDRTVELSFSSEYEVRRWYGMEVLGHKKGEVRMDRLQSGTAAVLVDHNRSDLVGVVESAQISEREGRAKVRFGKSPRAEEIFQDVKDKIRGLVSVGYNVLEAKLVETRDGVDVYRMTDWEPYEISIVSVPADPTVGIDRAAEENVQVEPPRESTETRVQHEPKIEGRMSEKTTEQPPVVDINAVRKSAAEEANARTATILQMGEQYKELALAAQFARDGKSAADFQAELLKRLNDRTSKPLGEQMQGAEIGLTDKEAKRFSFMRAIRHLADPSNQDARKAAAFEIECSRAAQDAYGKEAKGILVPADVLGRAFSTTTPASNTGANIVATELQSGSFIELLRKRTWVLQRARKLAGLVGNVDIPKQTVANTAYWVGEGSAPTAGEMGTKRVSLTPHTLAATTDITRRLLQQSTPDAEALTRDDIMRVMGIELDHAAIYGSGSSNQPTGVKLVSGINGVDFAAANPTFPELVQMETEIATDNADVASMSYVSTAAFRGYAKSTLKFSAAGSATIWEPGNTVNGYACDVTNQMLAGDVFFGNWDDLVVALWSGLDLTVDPYALSTSGGLRIIAFQDVDLSVRHPESFCWGSALVVP